MARNSLPLLCLVCTGFLVASMLLIGNVDAQNSDDKALIIVSSYNGTNQFELDKAIDLYDYLIDRGLQKEDIQFLCTGTLAIRDGDPTTSNIVNGFEWLAEDATTNSDVFIYVSDHTHAISSDPFYRFSDGNIYSSDIEDWLDDISYSTLNYITLGDHSGLIGSDLTDTDRTVISSMGSAQSVSIDAFDIARGLADTEADTDNDGIVSFEEAFYSEENLITGQDPVIW